LIAELEHSVRDVPYSNENVGFSPTLVIRGSTGPVRPGRNATR